jgi:HD-like signal output (HDOD) protein
MDKAAVFRTIAADLASGKASFPASAQVAMKVRKALEDPECPLETAVKLVQAEPVLAARVVAMANSPSYNPYGREFTDVRTSMQRLGFGTVRTLASAIVTRQLAGGGARNQRLVSQLWEHCARVAALARVIAQRVTHVDAETAMFAGLVHEVGGFYMLSRAAEFPGLIDGSSEAWVENGEAEVGRAVLQFLQVPPTVREAIESYWSGYLELPPRTLGDTLLLADALSPVASPLRDPETREAPSPLSADIDVALGEETLAGILKESMEEVDALTGALSF